MWRRPWTRAESKQSEAATGRKAAGRTRLSPETAWARLVSNQRPLACEARRPRARIGTQPPAENTCGLRTSPVDSGTQTAVFPSAVPYARPVSERNALKDLSKTRIGKAGDRLRATSLGDLELTDEERRAEREIVQSFRRAHAAPLNTVAAALRYHVAQESRLDQPPVQRLKRMNTIIDKLARGAAKGLSTMNDIAGCRAIVANLDELRALQARLEAHWDFARGPYDYIAEPKADGYRAVHLIVKRHGVRVEVQLRTVLQHLWADNIERTNLELKFGRGSDRERERHRKAAEGLAALDEKGPGGGLILAAQVLTNEQVSLDWPERS